MKTLAGLLTLAAVLTAAGGCKKAMSKLEQDAQVGADEKPKILPKTFGAEGGGGGGAVQAVRGSVQRVINENTLRDLHIFLNAASAESGNLPDAKAILSTLQADRTNRSSQELAKLIQDGSIVLTGTRQREGVWAYDANALKQAGWVVTSSGVERMDPATLQQRLKSQ